MGSLLGKCESATASPQGATRLQSFTTSSYNFCKCNLFSGHALGDQLLLAVPMEDATIALHDLRFSQPFRTLSASTVLDKTGMLMCIHMFQAANMLELGLNKILCF